jgi:hypothetical protein
MDLSKDLRHFLAEWRESNEGAPDHTEPLSEEERILYSDFEWAMEEMARGTFSEHSGKYIGIVNCQRVAVGDKPSAVRRAGSVKVGVAEERVVVVYVDRIERDDG